MKILKSDLEAALKFCQSAINIRGNKYRPILNSIKCIQSGDYIYFESTDLETMVRADVKIQARTMNENLKVFFLDPKMALDTLKLRVNSELDISLNEDTRVLKIDNTTMTTLNHSIDDYPNLDIKSNSGKVKKFNSELLLKRIEQIEAAVSNVETRLHLNSIYFDAENKRLVATDGHRLHAAENSNEIFSDIENSFLVHRDSLKTLKLFCKKNKAALFTIDENFIYFYAKNTALKIRLCNREYVEYAQIIPKKFKNKITLDSKNLVSALKSHIAAKAKSVTFSKVENSDSFKISSETLTIDAVNFSGDCDKMSHFGINPKFLLDAVEALIFKNKDSVKITLKCNGPLNPILLETKNANNVWAIVMPVKI